jgi:hypothetical protein
MKSHTILLIFLVVGTALASPTEEPYKFIASSPQDQKIVDAFHDQLLSAFISKNISAISECFYWGDTPEALRDKILHDIEENIEDYNPFPIFIFPIDSPYLNSGWVHREAGSKIMNGHKYDFNLKPQWVFTFGYKNPSDRRLNLLLPIGVSPEGKCKIPVLHRTK